LLNWPVYWPASRPSNTTQPFSLVFFVRLTGGSIVTGMSGTPVEPVRSTILIARLPLA
jgi:hypothetical protein